MLVHTKVLSELACPRPNPNVIAWFETQPTIHVSVVTFEELAFGIARATPKAKKALGSWFDALLEAKPTVLEVTSAIALTSGRLRAARERRGRKVAQADMLIAATALVHGLTLVTRNVADFEGCQVTLLDPFA